MGNIAYAKELLGIHEIFSVGSWKTVNIANLSNDIYNMRESKESCLKPLVSFPERDKLLESKSIMTAYIKPLLKEPTSVLFIIHMIK